MGIENGRSPVTCMRFLETHFHYRTARRQIHVTVPSPVLAFPFHTEDPGVPRSQTGALPTGPIWAITAPRHDRVDEHLLTKKILRPPMTRRWEARVSPFQISTMKRCRQVARNPSLTLPAFQGKPPRCCLHPRNRAGRRMVSQIEMGK